MVKKDSTMPLKVRKKCEISHCHNEIFLYETCSITNKNFRKACVVFGTCFRDI